MHKRYRQWLSVLVGLTLSPSLLAATWVSRVEPLVLQRWDAQDSGEWVQRPPDTLHYCDAEAIVGSLRWDTLGEQWAHWQRQWAEVTQWSRDAQQPEHSLTWLQADAQWQQASEQARQACQHASDAQALRADGLLAEQEAERHQAQCEHARRAERIQSQLFSQMKTQFTPERLAQVEQHQQALLAQKHTLERREEAQQLQTQHAGWWWPSDESRTAQSVQKGDPLGQLVAADAWVLPLQVDEQERLQIRTPHPVSVRLFAHPDVVLSGTLETILPNYEADGDGLALYEGTVQVILPPNWEPTWFFGMRAWVEADDVAG